MMIGTRVRIYSGIHYGKEGRITDMRPDARGRVQVELRPYESSKIEKRRYYVAHLEALGGTTRSDTRQSVSTWASTRARAKDGAAPRVGEEQGQ